MLSKNFKSVSKITLGLLTISILTGCGKASSIAPNIPVREYTSPTFSPSMTEFGPSLPEGTLPTDMKISGLDDKEKKAGEVLVPVGKIKQVYVDIKLNNNKILKSYNAVKWSVSNSEVGSINNRGIFTPLREGRTKVTASIGGVSASVDFVVSSAMNIWSQVISQTSKDLYSVKMVNDSEAFAVGQGGAIMHYLNGNWTDESSMVNSAADLTGIDVTEGGEAWAVGGSSILHYNGGRWESFPYSASGNLKSIDMLSSNDGWIVGSQPNGDALILRYTGGSWVPVQSKIGEELNTVNALGPNEVWVGGKSKFMSSPAIYKFDGGKWNKTRFGDSWPYIKTWDGTYEVKAIKMLNSSQGWAVGEYSPVLGGLRGKRGFMFHYDSVKDTWIRGTFDKANANLDQVPLKNIGMVSGGQGWVLGTNTPPNKLFSKEVNDIQGSFLKCDGKELKIDTQYQANTVGKSFYGIDILPNGNGIVVGENGFIMQHQYDLSRPNYFSNSGNYSNYNNYGTPSSYQGNTGYDTTYNY